MEMARRPAKTDRAKNAKPGTSTIQVRKQQFIRGEIWDAAVDLFAEKGFDETTIDDIASAAGVSRRSFFRYFSSKNDLMGQSMVSYAEALAGIIQSLSPGLSRFEVVRAIVLKFVSGAAAYPRTRKIMAVVAKCPEAREAQLSRMAEVEARVAQTLSDRFGDARYDELIPRLLAGLILTVIDVTLRLWFEANQPDISITAKQVLSKLGEIVGSAKQTRHRSASARRISRGTAAKTRVSGIR